MNNLEKFTVLEECWEELYGKDSTDLLEEFISKLQSIKSKKNNKKSDWYKDAIVYSLYVDLFNKDFKGLTEKLDYLSDLGVTCLWLLPILDSPMRDAGFDIRHYRRIRKDLLGEVTASESDDISIFENFLYEAHLRDIKVIFDIALNHSSDEHRWFQSAKSSEDNPYRDYYIWSKDSTKYKDARLLFKGMCPSNWEAQGDWYYFHRFFEFQPDLNYQNPKVLLEISDKLIFWLSKGVDGFRADAIPYIWKEDGTDCENLPKTHIVVKFFRTVLEIIKPDTLLLAEACQKPKHIVKYLETENECNAGYHFPLMPQMFKAIAQESSKPIIETLDIETTPEIPESAQWFTFLRCHDELSLELVYISEEDRKYIHNHYCHQPEWDFRLGEGISARLSELFLKDPKKIGLAYSIMLTLPGTPVIYYGDEYGKTNDTDFYHEMIKNSGKDDTRFLVRGKINWDKLENELNNPQSFFYKVYSQLSKQINTRKKLACFGRGELEWINIYDLDDKPLDQVLSYIREYKDEKVLIIQNLSDTEFSIKAPYQQMTTIDFDLLSQAILTNIEENSIKLPAHSYYWIDLSL